MLPKTSPHPGKNAVPQKLLKEEARLKERGIKLKETRFNSDSSNKLSEAIRS
jgi:hypothetical protein